MAENYPRTRPVYGREHAAAHIPDERGRRAEARRAAEALFAPKVPVQQPLDAPAPSAPAELVDATSGAEPPPPKMIPAAHLPRIRAWLRYGMTIAQVAAVYGVAVAEIQGMVQRQK
jgi:hypothetical protein